MQYKAIATCLLQYQYLRSTTNQMKIDQYIAIHTDVCSFPKKNTAQQQQFQNCICTAKLIWNFHRLVGIIIEYVLRPHNVSCG